jgi:preprotein translocase subunit YajC
MILQFAFFIFQAESGGGASIAQFLPLIGIMLVFYFIMFRPQQKRQKEMKQMQASLKNGDRVLTSSGVHGTIVGLRDDYVVLRIPPDSVKLEMQRSAILELENPTQENT